MTLHEQISNRAYEIWRDQQCRLVRYGPMALIPLTGQPAEPTDDLGIWLLAEKEVEAALAARVTPSAKPRA